MFTQICIFAALYFQIRANEKNLLSQLKADRDNTERLFYLQKHDADAKAYVPVLLEILKDIRVFHSALVYKGLFCPMIEHRCPNILWEDPKQSNNSSSDFFHSMSIAQRGQQFFLFGLRIVDNCRQIVFLAKSDELPETIALCKRIKDILFSLEQGKTTKLQKIVIDIQTYLKSTISNPNGHSESCSTNILEEDKEMFLDFYKKLDETVEKELPYLDER